MEKLKINRKMVFQFKDLCLLHQKENIIKVKDIDSCLFSRLTGTKDLAYDLGYAADHMCSKLSFEDSKALKTILSCGAYVEHDYNSRFYSSAELIKKELSTYSEDSEEFHNLFGCEGLIHCYNFSLNTLTAGMERLGISSEYIESLDEFRRYFHTVFFIATLASGRRLGLKHEGVFDSMKLSNNARNSTKNMLQCFSYLDYERLFMLYTLSSLGADTEYQSKVLNSKESPVEIYNKYLFSLKRFHSYPTTEESLIEWLMNNYNLSINLATAIKILGIECEKMYEEIADSEKEYLPSYLKETA